MVQVRKICIDSRYANSLSKSSTDFRLDLRDSIHLPDNTSVIVTDISIPHTWYSVEYYSDKLYFRVIDQDESFRDCIVSITRKNYTIQTLAEEIKNSMNAIFSSPIFTSSFDVTTATISLTITTPQKFLLFSDADLVDRVSNTWIGFDYDPFQPDSCNTVIGLSGKANLNNPYDSWKSSVIDTLGIHNIYITSPQFGNNSYGPLGERNILKKVVVNAPFGGLVTENWLNDHDRTDCSKNLLRSIEFKLTTSKGNTIDLHGAHCSFTLIFVFN